MTVYFQV